MYSSDYTKTWLSFSIQTLSYYTNYQRMIKMGKKCEETLAAVSTMNQEIIYFNIQTVAFLALSGKRWTLKALKGTTNQMHVIALQLKKLGLLQYKAIKFTLFTPSTVKLHHSTMINKVCTTMQTIFPLPFR